MVRGWLVPAIAWKEISGIGSLKVDWLGNSSGVAEKSGTPFSLFSQVYRHVIRWNKPCVVLEDGIDFWLGREPSGTSVVERKVLDWLRGCADSPRAKGLILVSDVLREKRRVWSSVMIVLRNVTCTRPSIVGLNLKQLLDDERSALEEDFSFEEVWLALCSCDGNKAPGPDGLNLRFIKTNREVIREDFMEFLKEFHRDRSIVKDLNMSFIALIEKVGKPETVRDFRLISLIGSMYKILAKVLANRLKKVMNSMIGEFQMAFVSSRQILDSYVMAEEIINKWKGDKVGVLCG
ncbi:hypothetical protein Dsin_012245 [Dipteronia sinensis]|uniref:Reverse transcriptase domain-containing protein n=1 Tax=Dipteronia sinensis TaxID=43782 RepID=A0AAE0E991_9ROSI|nr:hypothetical protein Dsin_012245 [Dipteronia sinensis]